MIAIAIKQMNNEPKYQEQPNKKTPGWKFTFVGGTSQKRGEDRSQAKFVTESISNNLTNKPAFPLSTTQVGDLVIIQQIQSEENMIHCLNNMGLTLGAEVLVTSKTTSGSIIVSLQGKQIGLGAEMANQVMATFATEKF